MSLLDLLRSSFVEDSTPMSLLDLLRSSFVFLGLPKMFTISILTLLLVADLLILGYDATASTNALHLVAL